MKTTCFFILMLVCCAPLACQTKQQTQTLEKLNARLKSGDLSISDVLVNPDWMSLHSLIPFRNMIRENAKAEKITITTPQEPGLKTAVRCTAVDGSGKPLANALVYYYQTSDKGWYSDTAAHINLTSGDMRHARIFGYQKTDAAGQFEFETIRPRGYPKSDLPAHIHIALWDSAGEPIYGLPDELLFEEDDRLTPTRKIMALESGFLVSKNVGTEVHAVYEYRMVKR